MLLALPDLITPATLILNPEHPLSDEDYFAFCAANPDTNIERRSAGEILILPPPGGESDYRSVKALVALDVWAARDRSGKAFGSSVQFLLPDNSGLSPDAAWVSNERLGSLSKRQLQKFPRLVPEFVIDVVSPSDRLAATQKKMRLWAANGVELGWLIDGTIGACMSIAEMLKRASWPMPRALINGEGPVEGFVLPLEEIWAGL